MKIEFCNLEAALGHARILRGVSLCAQPGKLTGVIGPNGCGKSTLIKTLFSIVKPSSGEILLDGEPTSRISPREIAMRIGYVSQESNIAFISVRVNPNGPLSPSPCPFGEAKPTR